MTTEQALRRLRILGLTKNDECVRRALEYIEKCISGESTIPDIPEVKPDCGLFVEIMQILADYKLAGSKLGFAVEWLIKQRDENGQWDMGVKVKDNVYFPLSDSWRKPEDRKRDCTERITKLIRKLEVHENAHL